MNSSPILLVFLVMTLLCTATRGLQQTTNISHIKKGLTTGEKSNSVKVNNNNYLKEQLEVQIDSIKTTILEIKKHEKVLKKNRGYKHNLEKKIKKLICLSIEQDTTTRLQVAY